MHNVFVYGTLKKGFPNHQTGMAGAVYVGRVRTIVAFPLVVGGRWFSPSLIDELGVGHRVFGELYEVGDQKLELLDSMEGTQHPHGYRRITVKLVNLRRGDECDAWTYVKDRKVIDGIHSDPLGEYILDSRYVGSSERTSAF
jgi:gamma-glutamylaminecyclotransferase